ncbi:unnamed protein product [Symbiodinium sp. CCMP2456]|nr:unnamed protein product [Symbiodinium sp. CCMP2456]
MAFLLIRFGALLMGVGSHPMAPTCHGFGGFGESCAAAKPGDPGKRRGSSLSGKTLAVKVQVTGCFSKACWLQTIRVGVDESNMAGSMSKVGVYLSDGRLAASSHALPVPTSLSDHAWLSFQLRGYDKELRTLSEMDHVWLVFNPADSVQLTYENVGSAEQATRYVSEPFSEAFAEVRNWDLQSARQWAGHFRNLRMQLDLGDVSIWPGTLPLILEAPHGGRIMQGWPARASGVWFADTNTDIFTEELFSELGLRCSGRFPRAIIFRVHRQGIDANRATGNASLTFPKLEPCISESNGQCCCDLPDAADADVAMTLNDVYHELLAEVVSGAPGALLVAIHGTSRHRVELGLRLSTSSLNEGAGNVPPSLQQYDASSSLRALGNATSMAWGPNSLGAFLSTANPSLEVVPSPKLRCPDPDTCPGSTYERYFMGGHNLKIHVSDERAGLQVELPKVMRGFSSSPPAPLATSIKQVGAAVASFLNAHYQEDCETDVNFGLACGEHGVAVTGGCVCDAGYKGEECSECSPEHVKVGSQCLDLVLLAPPADVTQKFGSAFTTTSSGRHYMYTRKFTTDLTRCGVAGCRPLNVSLRVRCDSSQCHSDVDDASYTVGAALYNSTGHKLCNGTVDRSVEAEKDWWLQVPIHSCPLLHAGDQAVYLSMWTTKLIKLRWEQTPAPAEISRGLTYRFDTDVIPPAKLPTWRDVPCEGVPCDSQQSCDCITGCTCRSWSLNGERNFYGLMAMLSLLPVPV